MRVSLLDRILFLAIGCALAAACRAASDDTGFTPPPNRPRESAWISLRHQHQETNLCVPTSASIILDYFGDSMSPRELKALSRNTVYGPGELFIDFTVTYFRDLIAGLARIGYSWREKLYSNDQRGFEHGLTEIEQSLDHRIPVMIETSLYYGHAYVVAGYSIRDQAIFVVDPAAEYPGTRAVKFETLGWVWNPRGASIHTDRRSAVFPQRRQK